MKKSNLNLKLDEILKNQKTILKNEKKIMGEESKLESLEEKEISKEDLEINDEKEALKELASLENELKSSISNPIKNITKKDFFKGFIGAFIGIVGHFAFEKGADIALELTFLQTTILYIVGFLIILIMLYYSGFRKIEKHIILKFMPIRALVLYLTSILTIILVNLLFGKIHLPISILELYKLVGSTIILAIIGAGTADLIGRSE